MEKQGEQNLYQDYPGEPPSGIVGLEAGKNQKEILKIRLKREREKMKDKSTVKDPSLKGQAERETLS